MKIARFSHQDSLRFGIVDDGELVVLTGDPLFAGYETTGERVPLTDATLLAPVIPRSKVVGVARGASGAQLFVKPNTAVIGSEDVVVRPAQAKVTDYAPALAVVIGSLTKHVSAADASAHILGYTVAADVTARDLLDADGWPDRAKGFDTFCPLGPVIETDRPGETGLTVSVGGTEALCADLAALYDAAPAAVSLASSVFTLLPGDVVLLPADADPIPFSAGDVVESTIAGIGTLRTAARDA